MTVGAFGRNRRMPFVSRAFSALCALCLFATLLMASGATQALAQGANPLSSSYITPFPQTDRYQLRVIGDWLGAGLTEGLKDAFKLEEGSLQIADMSRSNYGLVRAEQTDLYREIDRMISESPPHIVVVMLGVNDRASLKSGDGRAQPGSAEWKEAYAKEAEKLIRKLRSAKIAVYWVGLPIMNSRELSSEFVAAMNDAARQAAYVSGAKFIETWAGFTDQLGGYTAYGPDLTGQTKRLRDGNGIGLTSFGYRKLANYVEIVLRRDLAQAKAQRNIPLAGDEEEQTRVVPSVARALAKGATTPDWTTSASQSHPDPINAPASKQPQGVAASPASRTEPGAPPVAPDQQKRDTAAFGGAGFQGGEYVLADLGDGLTSIAVISPVGDFSMREIQRQTPLADRVYFKVLSKGEALPAKEGRADDFRWPPPEASAQ
jgi:uncharacterized protein